VTRTTSVPALQLGRLHGYMDSRVHPDVFAPRSPRIQLLPRPLSAAARAERPSGHAQPMAAAALTAAASTRAAAYLPTKVASAVPEALRKQSWDPIYSGHALPQQDRDSGFEYFPLAPRGGEAKLRVRREEATLLIGAEEATGEEAETEAVEGGAEAEAAAAARAESLAPPPTAPVSVRAGGAAPVGWLRHDFPTHTAGPPWQQAEALRRMMLQLERDDNTEHHAPAGGSAASRLETAYRRLAAYRELYGGVATELARQLRVESKTRASIFEAIVLKAWGLSDELLPELRRSSGLLSAAAAEVQAMQGELSTADAQCAQSERHAEQVSLLLSKERMSCASADLALLASKARVQQAEEQVVQAHQANGELEAQRGEYALELEAAGQRAAALEQRLRSARHEAEEAQASLTRLQLRWGADQATLEQADDGLVSSRAEAAGLLAERNAFQARAARLELEVGELIAAQRASTSDAASSLAEVKLAERASASRMQGVIAHIGARSMLERRAAIKAAAAHRAQLGAKDAENSKLYERLQVSKQATHAAESMAETLQYQVEEHLAGHGAEVSKLRTARDDSLQVAAALRKRLESAEAALGGLQHFEQQQQAQQAQAQQRAQQQAQQLAQQLAQVQQAQQQAARITDLGAELARAAAALAAERIAHAAAAAELQTLKAEATTLRADGAANHARMLLLTRESTALMRNAYAADLAKAKGRTETYTQSELTGHAASLNHAAVVAAEVSAARAEDRATIRTAEEAVRVQRFVFASSLSEEDAQGHELRTKLTSVQGTLRRLNAADQAVLACVHGSTSRGSSPQLVDDLGAPSSTTSSVGSSSPPSINGAAAMRAGVGAVLSAGRFVSPRRACLRGNQADTILEAAVEARLRPRRTSDTMLAGVARKIELLTIKAREAALRQQQLKIRELLEQMGSSLAEVRAEGLAPPGHASPAFAKVLLLCEEMDRSAQQWDGAGGESRRSLSPAPSLRRAMSPPAAPRAEIGVQTERWVPHRVPLCMSDLQPRQAEQTQGAVAPGEQEKVEQEQLRGAMAEERRGAAALHAQVTTLTAARDAARAEAAALRCAVRAAVSAGRRETASLKPEELRSEVTKLRYELELTRVREAIDCRDAAAVALAALQRQFEAHVTRAEERLGAFVLRSEVLSGGGSGGGGGGGGGDGGRGGDGGGSGDGSGVSSVARVSQEMAAMWQRMLREFGSTTRTLRGQLLREAPSAPPPPAGSTAAASRLWLQSCLAQVFPRHLICVFDPAAADDEQQRAWHIVSTYSRVDPQTAPPPQAAARSTAEFTSGLHSRLPFPPGQLTRGKGRDLR